MTYSTELQAMIDCVHHLVRKYNPQLYFNSSRMTIFKYALEQEYITSEEYDHAKNYFGPIFDYVGD